MLGFCAGSFGPLFCVVFHFNAMYLALRFFLCSFSLCHVLGFTFFLV